MPKVNWRLCGVALSVMWLAGCAFNIISVQQRPAQFEAVTNAQSAWSLTTTVRIALPEGKTSPLKAESTWRQVGRIAQGDVFHTTDQNVWVVASHQHEADIVVKGGQVVGFYLRVEGTFAPASQPVDIKTIAR